MDPINYLSMIQPPNLAQAGMEGMQLGQALHQRFGRRGQEEKLQDLQIETAIRAQQEDTRYKGDVAQVLANPTPEGYRALMLRYPRQHEALKDAWGAYTEGQRTRNVEAATSVYSGLANGRSDVALATLKRRKEALTAAGEDTTETDALIDMVESGDPAKLRQAQGFAGMVLAAATGPDKVGPTLEALTNSGKRRTAVIDDILVDADTGQPIAQSPYPRIVPGTEGAFYQQERVGTIPVFGGQSAAAGAPSPAAPVGGTAAGGGGAPRPSAALVPNAAAVARSLYPDARITDWRRDPKSRLGRANPGSYHVRSGAAVDVAPIQGMSFDQFVRGFKDQGFTIVEERDEVKNPSAHATGPHWHVVLGIPHIMTQQQYAKLPKGAHYIAPDGSNRTKS